MSMRWMAWSLGGLLAIAGSACGDDSPDGNPFGGTSGSAVGTTGTSGTPATTGSGTTGSGTTGSSVTTGGGTTGTPATTGGGAGPNTTGTSGSSTTGASGLSTTGASGLDTTGTTGAGETTGSTGTLGADCTSLPKVSDYAAKGPFADAKMFPSVGPNGNYVMYRPDASLGKDGFKHPMVAWGNGIATTPDVYKNLLTHLASHGFIIIACPEIVSEEPCLSQGLDWLAQQNTAAGPLQGKIDTSREATLGYSWGGGAAIDTSKRPNVKATVSLHGMPPRNNPWAQMHAPLLLTTSLGDTFVSAEGYVTPNYNKSQVQTFYATLNEPNEGHMYIVDSGAAVCDLAWIFVSDGSKCGSATLEQPAVAAWMRLWACGDEGARNYFYGDDCTLCSGQWTNPQTKNWQ